MAKLTTAIKTDAAKDKPHPDGRRQRSRASRAKIITAFMELTEAGDPSPSAARVAERAGVGLRSVFRNFDDMDSLYYEMNQVLEDRTLPILLQPCVSTNWREQLIELVQRRAEVYELIAPHRIIATIARFRSNALMNNYRRLMKYEHEALNKILPKSVQKDKQRNRAILLAVSFDSWRLFQQDEGLSNKQVIATMSQMVQNIVAQIDN